MISFSAAELLLRASYGGGVGRCSVEIRPGDAPSCSVYVKVAGRSFPYLKVLRPL